MDLITMFLSYNDNLIRVTDMSATHYICNNILIPMKDVIVEDDILTKRKPNTYYLYERVNVRY